MEWSKKLFRFDRAFRRETAGSIAGVDEAGRGPLAGPVVAAAVIFRGGNRLPGLNDSKKLTPQKREVLFNQIICRASVAVARISESLVDKINILEATRLAMREAVLALPKTPSLLLIDGRIRLDLPIRQLGIIQGDGQSAAIAAASIIAKVHRDYWMKKLDFIYPGYRFSIHKGYPTREHLALLRERGPSPVHRKSFRPVIEAEMVGGRYV